jgi:hypothetical protein
VSDPDTILLLVLQLLTRPSFTSGLTQTPNPDTVLPLPVRCERSRITWRPVLAICAHKKIFYQVETTTGNYTVNCNPITMDPFHYYAEYRVLVCKSCQYAVYPSTKSVNEYTCTPIFLLGNPKLPGCRLTKVRCVLRTSPECQIRRGGVVRSF